MRPDRHRGSNGCVAVTLFAQSSLIWTNMKTNRWKLTRVAIATTMLMSALTSGLTSILSGGTGRASVAAITVTSAADSGAGSLRQAIIDAPSGATINFSL